MATRQIIDPGWAWVDELAYAQCVRVGDMLALAGQAPVGRDGALVGEGDIAAQTRQTFENVAAVLAAAGSTMDDIVDVTYYLTNMADVMAVAGVMVGYLPQEPPAGTVIGVTSLFFPGQLVEIRATALAH
jgi:enamine deaminase RidA (YjgF/YER057c/UK114 family)